MGKIIKALLIGATITCAISGSVSAKGTNELKQTDSVAATKNNSGGITPYITIPDSCSLQYSYFGDYVYGQTNHYIKYIAKSVAYCGVGNYSSRQAIDKITAKARIYATGTLQQSKEDIELFASYAAIATDWVENSTGDGYGNHIFQNAGYTDWTPESHDTDPASQTAPY
ncbi:hypothetical protein M5X11_16645 [Paenibacillus alginolyticus]|uniref:hypothetical protein n=1 Tax=Paenibacillus alginolyticus TaxID=59839 RepID=UPI000492AD88|nr:hypothetical protein [Paenibacillus alginolyticus]MCY9666545.1 hypothetical protein [Paenibacillus alginolyticus]